MILHLGTQDSVGVAAVESLQQHKHVAVDAVRMEAVALIHNHPGVTQNKVVLHDYVSILVRIINY